MNSYRILAHKFLKRAGQLTALGILYALSTQAQAATAGGATIHNVATLNYDGGTAVASVDVSVTTVAAAPTLSLDTTTQSVTGTATTTYTYTIVNNGSGSDTLNLSASSVDVGMSGPPGLDLNSTGTNTTSITLGGTVTSQPSSAGGVITIPAGSESDFSVSDVVVIPGYGTYSISAINTGTPASTDGAGVTTAETPSTLTLSVISGTPIGAGTIPAGVQVGEQYSFNLDLTASTPTSGSGSHTVNISGSTTAVTSGASGTIINFATSAADGNESVTTVTNMLVNMTMEARNVTQGLAFGAVSTVVGQSGDVLEYRITATPDAGSLDATGNNLVTDVPTFTTYVINSTTLNGNPVGDGAGSTLPLTSANGGLAVNSPSGTAGVIVAGENAVIIFQVTIN